MGSDPLQALLQARQQTAKLLDELNRQHEELSRMLHSDYAPGQAALARAVDSAAHLLHSIDEALKQAQRRSDG